MSEWVCLCLFIQAGVSNALGAAYYKACKLKSLLFLNVIHYDICTKVATWYVRYKKKCTCTLLAYIGFFCTNTKSTWFWNEDQEKLHDVGSELQDKSREAKLVLHPILFRRRTKQD